MLSTLTDYCRIILLQMVPIIVTQTCKCKHSLLSIPSESFLGYPNLLGYVWHTNMSRQRKKKPSSQNPVVICKTYTENINVMKTIRAGYGEAHHHETFHRLVGFGFADNVNT